jgi:hypothetical protein
MIFINNEEHKWTRVIKVNMKIEELRIGNCLYFVTDKPGSECVISGVSLFDNLVYSGGVNGVNADRGIEDFKPIYITEEYLIKVGFENKGKYTYQKDWIRITSPEFEGECYSFLVGAKFKYVHQLQNLFYCLTGTELTIK